MNKINYGPLAGLIGIWKGDKGLDIAPEPSGTENNPYYETITFEAIGDVENAETQTLAILFYTQIASRKSNDEVFHHQSGYWTWDAETGVITQSFSIPRGVSVVASGRVLDSDDIPAHVVKIEVSAEESGFDGGIAQSTFMQKNARTNTFSQILALDGDTLSYEQTTMLDIYHKTFEHTDNNTLTRQK